MTACRGPVPSLTLPDAGRPLASWRGQGAWRRRAWLVLPLLMAALLVLPAGAMAASPNPAPHGALSAKGCAPAPMGGSAAVAAGTHAAPLALAGRGSDGRGGDRLAGRGGDGGGTATGATSDQTGGEAALFEQALAASRAGRFADALPLWDELLRRHPADAAAWSNRGNVRLALGDAEGAIADQEQAMVLDPQHTDPHTQLRLSKFRPAYCCSA